MDNKVVNIPAKKRENYRGYIHSKDCSYYIINEIVAGDNAKVFSAVKFVSGKDSPNKMLDDQRYCVRYISKDWIKKEVFSKLKMTEDKIKKFFDYLRQSYRDFKNIKFPYIQELKDYIDDEEGIYTVFEFCDWTLKDYVQILREPVRNTRYPFEIKMRKIIIQILETIHFLHENHSLTFGGLLNSSDIMVTEYTDSNSVNSTLIKFPHPFVSHLLTVLKVYNAGHFPSHYAPEVYKLFEEDSILKVIEKKEAFDLGNLLTKINQNFDIWCLGYLLYEILLDIPPFVFDSLSAALASLNESFTYKIHPYHVSPLALKLINMCLQLEAQDRIQSFLLKEAIDEMQKDADNPEEVEKMLRARMTSIHSKEEFELFYLNTLTYDKYGN